MRIKVEVLHYNCQFCGRSQKSESALKTMQCENCGKFKCTRCGKGALCNACLGKVSVDSQKKYKRLVYTIRFLEIFYFFCLFVPMSALIILAAYFPDTSDEILRIIIPLFVSISGLAFFPGVCFFMTLMKRAGALIVNKAVKIIDEENI